MTHGQTYHSSAEKPPEHDLPDSADRLHDRKCDERHEGLEIPRRLALLRGYDQEEVDAEHGRQRDGFVGDDGL